MDFMDFSRRLYRWASEGVDMYAHAYSFPLGSRGVARIFGGGGGGAERRGGVPRSPKEANKPNKCATELKPRTCTHQGSMFRPY